MNPFLVAEKLENPQDGIQFILHLMRGRSAFRVFSALATLADTEEKLELLLTAREFLEFIDELAVSFAAIRKELDSLGSEPVNMDAYLQMLVTHFPHVSDAAQEFAELLHVDAADIVSVMLTA